MGSNPELIDDCWCKELKCPNCGKNILGVRSTFFYLVKYPEVRPDGEYDDEIIKCPHCCKTLGVRLRKGVVKT